MSEKVEIMWLVAATVLDAGHVTVVADTKRTLMYWDADIRRGDGQWERDWTYATHYETRREALKAAVMLAVQRPQYMGKLKISRKRRVWHPLPPPPNA